MNEILKAAQLHEVREAASLEWLAAYRRGDKADAQAWFDTGQAAGAELAMIWRASIDALDLAKVSAEYRYQYRASADPESTEWADSAEKIQDKLKLPPLE